MLTRKGRKRLAYKWLQKLRTEYPDMFQLAVQLNLRDDFIMWVPGVSAASKLRINKEPYGESSSSEISSSSSSDSSDVSSDDEQTIHTIRDGCEPFEEEYRENFECFNNPKIRFILFMMKVNKRIKNKLKQKNLEMVAQIADREAEKTIKTKPARSRSHSAEGDV